MTAADLERVNYSVPEVAQRLGISKQTVYRMCISGELGSTFYGSRRLIPVGVFDAHVAAREAAAQS